MDPLSVFGAGISLLAGGSRGGAQKPLQNYRPTGINAGGFNFGITGGSSPNQFAGGNASSITGGSNAERLNYLRNISGLYGKQAGEIRSLRDQVKPGFSTFRSALGGVQNARIQNIRNARDASVGNLRENLAQRRLSGSSFAQNALSRANAEFAQQEDQILADIGLQQAQTTLQELEATRGLIGQEYDLGRQSVQTFIDNLNLEAGIATQLATGATNALAANAKAQADILQEQQNNTQEILTDIGGAIYARGG